MWYNILHVWCNVMGHLPIRLQSYEHKLKDIVERGTEQKGLLIPELL